MNLGLQAQWNATRKRPVWYPAPFSTDGQIVVNRVLKLLLKLRNGIALEDDYIACIYYFTMKDTRVVIKAHRSIVSSILHHGLIPASLRNLLKDLTILFLTSFSGCGR